MIVNYLLIGAGRSGSTSLCKYLEQQHEVSFSSIKEVHYFSQQDLYERGERYLHSFFTKKADVNVYATADTYLLIDDKAIQRIKAYNPSMHFIVVLRDPLQRAISSFNYAVNYGYQPETMSLQNAFEQEEAILNEEKSIIQQNNKLHFYSGLYYHHLCKWLAEFPKDQFFIARTTDLKNDPLQVLNQFADFAGISKLTQLEEIHTNKAAVSKLKWLEQFLLNRESFPRSVIRNLTPRFVKQLIIRSGSVDKIHAMNRSDKPIQTNVDLSVVEAMKAYFQEDLVQLRTHLGVDLIN